MVSVGTTLGYDTRWTELLTIGPVGRLGNVSVVVTDAGFAKLPGTIDVAVLPIFAECISVVLTEQSELRRCIAGRRFARLLTNESELFAHESELLTNQPEILSDESELQPDIAEL